MWRRLSSLRQSHQRCDLKKPIRAKPWVDNRARTATPHTGNVGPMGFDRSWATYPGLRPGLFDVAPLARQPVHSESEISFVAPTTPIGKASTLTTGINSKR
jgi:hypothetical protein